LAGASCNEMKVISLNSSLLSCADMSIYIYYIYIYIYIYLSHEFCFVSWHVPQLWIKVEMISPLKLIEMAELSTSPTPMYS
jgi:hypothetical protein